MSSLPRFSESGHQTSPQEERVASLLETFFLHACQAHRAEAGVAAGVPCPRPRGQVASGDEHGHEDVAMPLRDLARAWLEGQGFDLSGGDDPPIGLFMGGQWVRQQLLAAGFAPEEIDASALADDPRLAGRLVGPIRNRFGRILSFWAHHPEDRPHKFLFKGKWKDEAGLFGLDVARVPCPRPRGHDASGDEHGHEDVAMPPVIVVQRLLDALLLQSKGLPGAVAIGGSPRELGKRRWQQLSALGSRRVILAFDTGVGRISNPSTANATDYKSVSGADDSLHDTLTALERALRVKPAIEVFVLPPESLRGYRDPAELLRAEGAAALEEVLEAGPVHAYRFKASAILGRHRAGRGWTDAGRHAAWKEAVEFYALQGRRAAPNLDRHFVPAIVAGLERTWDTFEPIAGNHGQPEAPEPPAEVPDGPGEPRPSVPRRLSGTCPIHGCDATSCFCFD
jgi:hypothetical protein